MTKPRKPVSIEDAIVQAIGVLGAERCARAIGRTPAVLYAAADPDRAEMLRTDHMIALDIEMMREVGRAPGLEAYGAAVRASEADLPAATLAQLAGAMAKESGEAVAALVNLPETASPADLDEVARELAEAQSAINAAMADVERRRRAIARKARKS